MTRETLRLESAALFLQDGRGRRVGKTEEKYIPSKSIVKNLQIIRDRTTDEHTKRDLQWLLDTIGQFGPTL